MSSFFLKLFAIIFMIIDHVGFIIFPSNFILRAIGRLAFPLFAYQMAVGFSHTRNKEKHILKLLAFAILCQIPTLITYNILQIDAGLNIIFTFVISLLIIYNIENIHIFDNSAENKKIAFKNILITLLVSFLLVFIGIYLNVDYTWYGILLTVFFYFTLKNKPLSMLGFTLLIILNSFISNNLMSILAYISVLDCLFILAFNGKRGYKTSWLFYAIYFLHFFPLLLIKHILI